MAMTDRIDFTKLLGFRTVSEQSAQGIDFKDETVAARLGAKVGGIGESDMPQHKPARPAAGNE